MNMLGLLLCIMDSQMLDIYVLFHCILICSFVHFFGCFIAVFLSLLALGLGCWVSLMIISSVYYYCDLLFMQ